MYREVDLYAQAERERDRRVLDDLRVVARCQLSSAGLTSTAEAVGRFLASQWYRLPEPVAELVWSLNARRERRRARRRRWRKLVGYARASSDCGPHGY